MEKSIQAYSLTELAQATGKRSFLSKTFREKLSGNYRKEEKI